MRLGKDAGSAKADFSVRLQGALLVLALAHGSFAFAAAPVAPDAGQLLQNIKPLAPPAPSSPDSALPETTPPGVVPEGGGATVTVSAFHIDGATAFSQAELQALVADAIGKPLSLGQIKAAVERITAHYRQHGYLLARAYLPPQQIQGGNVEVRVLEGQLGKLHLKNTSLLSDAAVQRQLQQLPEGQPVKAEALDRDLLLLNTLPGASVRSTLKPGEAVGSTDLDIAVAPTPRVNGSLAFDDEGNRYTGSNRLTGAVHVNSPAGQGDSLGLLTQLARGTDYARADYELPVGGWGTQIGGNASILDYKLGGDFKPLQAFGSATDYGLSLAQPLLRSRAETFDFNANLDRKRLDDVVDSTNLDTLKDINVLTLGLTSNRHDGWGGGGATVSALTLTEGELHLDDATDQLDQQGHRTAGQYDKVLAQLSRQQFLGGAFSLSAILSGQWAGKNLDSTEKMSLGGVSAVRAYAPGESASDEALLTQLELRYAFTTEWQLGAFADAARGLLNKHPLASDPPNGRNLAGEGVSLYWSRSRLALQGFAAWRDGAAPTTPSNSRWRLGVQLTAYF